jgi:hypothetical protein
VVWSLEALSPLGKLSLPPGMAHAASSSAARHAMKASRERAYAADATMMFVPDLPEGPLIHPSRQFKPATSAVFRLR